MRMRRGQSSEAAAAWSCSSGLKDALADGDHIYATIRGAAVNNDGSDKVSYVAPSVNGQAEVISLAHALADVTADTIDYVEAHGTATPLGDPIEVNALTQAFRATTDRSGYCFLGTVKTNVGHLESAAGVTGLIKTALALEEGVIPPSLQFTAPNPRSILPGVRSESSLTEPSGRGGPSSSCGREFVRHRRNQCSRGAGGSAARGIEQAAESPQIIVLSARSLKALEDATDRLAKHFRANPELSIGDVAWTLQTGGALSNFDAF
jgi:acyl transferase domain-containing protein